MEEFVYAIGQRTSRAPVIRKLGAVRRGMEQTPVLFRGEIYLAESVEADESCDGPYIHIRCDRTGETTAPFGRNYYFASAYVEDDTFYIFATNRHDTEKMTMYDGNDAGAWHDPRGGHTVHCFKTTDLKHFTESDVLTSPERRLWNTSVCKGDGRYIMAVEVSAEPGFESAAVGNPFTCFFAESDDLVHWRWLPDECAYTPARYNACPAIRFANGRYYMICLEAFPCARYAPYIYRTADFCRWEVGFHNPIMMWDDEDRRVRAGAHFTAEELDLLEHGLNINCSDVDLCELDGKTHLFYANGDQMTYSFLCEAVYDGGLTEFLEAFFR